MHAPEDRSGLCSGHTQAPFLISRKPSHSHVAPVQRLFSGHDLQTPWSQRGMAGGHSQDFPFQTLFDSHWQRAPSQRGRSDGQAQVVPVQIFPPGQGSHTRFITTHCVPALHSHASFVPLKVMFGGQDGSMHFRERADHCVGGGHAQLCFWLSHFVPPAQSFRRQVFAVRS